MPLFLLYLSNIGDILAKSFKWFYAKICLCQVCPGVSRRRALRARRKSNDIGYNPDWMTELDAMGNNGWDTNDTEESSHSGGGNYIDRIETSEDSESNADYNEDTSTITVPLTVCLMIMIGYIMFGGLLFAKWEKWDLLNGSYFCFISLSSIGFGDLVPGFEVRKIFYAM